MTTEIYPHITVDPAVCLGKPTIRGMRIRVSDVLDLFAVGETQQDILRDYPYLEAEDIKAVLRYAARASDHPLAFAAAE